MNPGAIVEISTFRRIPWRCLHGGFLRAEDLDEDGPDPAIDGSALRARNLPLLGALAGTYGSCAVVAREEGRIVATLRFYPRAVLTLAGSIGFCLQQPFPWGPPEGFTGHGFPPAPDLEDRTLRIHCLAVGRPGSTEDPRRRKGLGTRLVKALVEWARPRGWRAIEAVTHTDLDVLYAVSGAAGRTFWEKLGFREARRDVEPELQKEGALLESLRREAAARRIPRDRIADRFTMHLDLAEDVPA